MANFKDYLFNQSLVSSITVDEVGGQYLWIAYSLKSGTCRLQKVSAHDLTQVYFTIELPVDSINDMKIFASTLYIAVTHSTTALYLIDVNTPLSSQIIYTKTELDLTESPIAVNVSATDIYFLTPGILSGNNSQLVIFDSGGDYTTTIDLIISGILVHNAVSLTIDSNDNIWIVSDGDPTNLYRIFLLSGVWQIEETILE